MCIRYVRNTPPVGMAGVRVSQYSRIVVYSDSIAGILLEYSQCVSITGCGIHESRYIRKYIASVFRSIQHVFRLRAQNTNAIHTHYTVAIHFTLVYCASIMGYTWDTLTNTYGIQLHYMYRVTGREYDLTSPEYNVRTYYT